MTIRPIHPESGQPFKHPDLPGGLSGVVGWCGHRVAEQEWRAGYRVCERCPRSNFEPANRRLVLRSYLGNPEAVYERDDKAAEEGGYVDGERWFPIGDGSEEPLCWTSLAGTATREGDVLTVLQAAIDNLVLPQPADLDGAAQIAAHVARGDSAEALFYAGAQRMLDAVRDALRGAVAR